MEVLELNVLNTATAEDFKVVKVVGVGQHGMVVSATCTLPGHPNPEKLYAVKLLFTFMHDFTSAIRNAYENEWAVLSRILPHRNVVRYWAQFISLIPLSFVPHLPDHIRRYAAGKDRSGESVRRKGQFVVFDYHPNNLRSWLQDEPVPLPFDSLFSLLQDLLRAVIHLQQYRVAHLDLKLDNVLISAEGRAVLCDFGCSHQFATADMAMSYHHGNQVGGNKAHLSPGVITQYNQLKHSLNSRGEIDYSQQEAWAVGVLTYEMAMGRHPFVDYPLGHTNAHGVVSYRLEDLPSFPETYPKAFRSIVRELLHPNAAKRMSAKEALKQLQLCFPKSAERREVERLTAQLKAAQLARDLAEQKASCLIAERDEAQHEAREARRELREYTARCKKLEEECAHARRERREAVEASSQAMESQEMLTQQVDLLRREKDLALRQVAELRKGDIAGKLKDGIRECMRCKTFYIESENGTSSCLWHPGRFLFNRWSCCYKKDGNAIGCRAATHIDAATGQS